MFEEFNVSSDVGADLDRLGLLHYVKFWAPRVRGVLTPFCRFPDPRLSTKRGGLLNLRNVPAS